MALTKEKKVEIVSKLNDIVEKSQSVVFVNFHKLSVSEVNEMRKELHIRNVGYFVAKKTLVRRALSNLKIEGTLPEFEGELAVAYGEDPVAPASGILEFAKKYKDSLAILGGIFEKKYQSKEEMNVIASIPPLEILYGQFVNVINSPIQGLVLVLNEIAQKKEA